MITWLCITLCSAPSPLCHTTATMPLYNTQQRTLSCIARELLSPTYPRYHEKMFMLVDLYHHKYCILCMNISGVPPPAYMQIHYYCQYSRQLLRHLQMLQYDRVIWFIEVNKRRLGMQHRGELVWRDRVEKMLWILRDVVCLFEAPGLIYWWSRSVQVWWVGHLSSVGDYGAASLFFFLMWAIKKLYSK